MKTKGLTLTMVLAVAGSTMIAGAGRANADIHFGGEASCLYTYDFEDYADFAGPLGSAFVTLGDADLGITFGASLVGQSNTPVDGFDVISGTPVVPLTIDTSVDANQAINVLTFGNTVIDGLGPAGFPDPEGIAEGSVTVLFERDQEVVAFDLLAGNGGWVNVQFFDRSGALLGDITLGDNTSNTYAFGSDEADIAAITLCNMDLGGLLYDNFRFSPNPADRPTWCDIPGPYVIEQDAGTTAIELDGRVWDDPSGNLYDYEWITDCPGAYFNDDTSATTTLFINPASPLQAECQLTLIVKNEGETDICSTEVTIEGETGSSVTCPPDMTVESDGSGNLAELDAWLDSAESDDPTLTNDFEAFDYVCGAAGSATVTWFVTSEGSGAWEGPTECSATFTIVDTVPPELTVDTTPIVVEDTDCSGVEFVELPPADVDHSGDDGVTVTVDAPDAFPAGETTTVTYTATDDCGNTSTATVDVTVLYGAGIKVHVLEHTLGSGRRARRTRPEPLADVHVAVYDASRVSCVRELVRRERRYPWRILEFIVAECEPANTGVTDEGGVALVDVPPGQYVVIAQIDSDGDGVTDDYLGRHVGRVRCGQWKTRRLIRRMDAHGNRIIDEDISGGIR
ncbi:MAG: HYR domain-containing protein [Phycisphaerae bacterium]